MATRPTTDTETGGASAPSDLRPFDPDMLVIRATNPPASPLDAFAAALDEYECASAAERAHAYPDTNQGERESKRLWNERWAAYERLLDTPAPNLACVGEKIRAARDILGFDNEADALLCADAIARDVARLSAACPLLQGSA